MPSYDVKNGKLVGAPSLYQKSWANFQGEKAPISSAQQYRDQAKGDEGGGKTKKRSK